MNRSTRHRKWLVYTDGAIRPEKSISGLAAIVRDEHGQILYWWQRRAGGMTCNEAEYAAAIFAFEQLQQLRLHGRKEETHVFSDSLVMVDQMSGRAVAHAPGLRLAQGRLRFLVSKFHIVTFHHISREQNRLADALAYEAVEGLPVPEIRPLPQPADVSAWDSFLASRRQT